MLAGRPHETAGNGSPRWMTAASRERAHRTRPTGRLTPIHAFELRFPAAIQGPVHIGCTCPGAGRLRGPGARRREGAVEGVAGPGAGLWDQVPVEVDGRGDGLVPACTGPRPRSSGISMAGRSSRPCGTFRGSPCSSWPTSPCITRMLPRSTRRHRWTSSP